MAVIFGNMLSDYLDSPVVINIDADTLKKNNIFPAISVCIQKYNNFRANNERVKKFVQKYFSEKFVQKKFF